MVEPKPDGVEIPESYDWEELTPYQRYYYKNRESEKERTSSRRDELKKWMRELKDGLECHRCGYGDHPAAIVFHHPGDKREEVGRMVDNGFSKKSIRDEIEKCETLCANCHRIVHNGD